MPAILVLLIGQVSSKYGMSISQSGYKIFGVQVFLIFLALGYFCLFVRGIIWINVLKKIDLSIAYPLTSFSIILVMIASNYFFDEVITVKKIIGSMLIIIGGIVVTLKKSK